MIFASRSSTSKDGELWLIHPDRREGVSLRDLAPSLLHALENWKALSPKFAEKNSQLRAGQLKTEKVDWDQFESALPRTFLFADGSAFINHIKLVRKARNAELPATLETVPLMYQAESARFLRPTEPIAQLDFAHGTDFEAEVGVITDFVPMGVSATEALNCIRLLVLINDVSLRGLIPAELAQGFGFFQSKPAKALSPMALTLDEVGSAWRDGRVHLPLSVNLNQKTFGRPNAREMHFHFGQLIAHAARTRDLQPGTLIGSGTVSNADSAVGCGCLAEVRTLETLQDGKPKTPFMKAGDRVEIWMEDAQGKDLFGRIDQVVVAR